MQGPHHLYCDLLPSPCLCFLQKTRQKIDALRAHSYRELDSRIKRHEKIAKLIAQLQTRKNLQVRAVM